MIVRSLGKTNRRHGFTLVELLITISIIGIMASMVMFAMFSAQEAAREQKTRALIAKLNNIVMQRYESYRTRRVPFVFPTIPQGASDAHKLLYASEISKARLDCLRDLMRMEMPERWSDVVDDPVAPFAHSLPASANVAAYSGTIARPSVNTAYKRKHTALGTATAEHQYAECLYMIVMETLAQEGDARDVFKAGDSGDIDGDGFPEFHDAWRRPIRFLRWSGGFTSPVNQIAAGRVSSANVSSQTATVILQPSPTFGASGAPYLDGVMAVLVDGRIVADRMCKITGYNYSAGVATFSFETKTPVPPPFAPGGQPNNNDIVVIMAADPFDSRGVYPRDGSAFTKTPTFAMYPLIFSAGRDGAFGVICDTGGLSYATELLMPIVFDNTKQMMGTEKALTGEPENCWLDNITSHDLNRR